MTNKTCLNCGWAKWEWTDHTPPRINPNRPGFCRWNMTPDFIAVMACAPIHVQNELNAVINWRVHDGWPIWSDGVDPRCPAWKKIES